MHSSSSCSGLNLPSESELWRCRSIPECGRIQSKEGIAKPRSGDNKGLQHLWITLWTD